MDPVIIRTSQTSSKHKCIFSIWFGTAKSANAFLKFKNSCALGGFFALKYIFSEFSIINSIFVDRFLCNKPWKKKKIYYKRIIIKWMREKNKDMKKKMLGSQSYLCKKLRTLSTQIDQ